MILSDEYKVVFVHIPKCAGTSVRNVLAPIDSRNGEFARRGEHPVLGFLDYAHIPLFILKEHFKDCFDVIGLYWSFAIVRDPYSRFSSSVSQRLNMYSDKPIHMRRVDEIRAEINRCIEFLSARSNKNELLPPDYIHFQRQVDYVELDGCLVIDKLYTVHDIKDLVADLERITGAPLTRKYSSPPKENQSVVFRNDLIRNIYGLLHPATRKVSGYMPESLKNMLRSRIYVPRDDKLKELFLSKEVKDFVSDFYSEDVALYDAVKSGKTLNKTRNQ